MSWFPNRVLLAQALISLLMLAEAPEWPSPNQTGSDSADAWADVGNALERFGASLGQDIGSG